MILFNINILGTDTPLYLMVELFMGKMLQSINSKNNGIQKIHKYR